MLIGIPPFQDGADTILTVRIYLSSLLLQLMLREFFCARKKFFAQGGKRSAPLRNSSFVFVFYGSLSKRRFLIYQGFQNLRVNAFSHESERRDDA